MKKSLTALACAVLLAGCATTGTAPRSGDVTRGGQQPRHTIKVMTANSDLRAQVAAALEGTANLAPVTEEAFSAYTLVLNDGLSTARADNLGGKPRIVGVLRAEQRPATYRVGYQLLDLRGQAVASGDVTGVGDSQKAMFPALRDAGSASPAALSDALQQLAKELSQKLATQQWRSTVTGQMGTLVAIEGSRTQGLREGMTFKVEEIPETVLKLVGFGSDDKPLLEVVQGTPPSNGLTVIRSR
jgi:hypothetical protein